MAFDVSVVVPTYNRARVLPETIDAVLAQTHPPVELIVVDDSSPDHTAEVVRGYGERVKYLKVPNGRAELARNRGAAIARGNWLAFCDDDDLWKPDLLKRFAEVVGAAPDVRFLFCDFHIVRDGVWQPARKFDEAPAGYWDGDFTAVGPARVYRDPMTPRTLRFQPVFMSCLAVRRDWFDELGGFNPAFSGTGSADWEFVLRAVAAPPVAAVFEPLAGIRKHSGNMSGDLLFVKEGEVAILRHALAHYPSVAVHRELIEEQIVGRSIDATELAFARGEFDRVRSNSRALPRHRAGFKLRLKRWVAGLPTPLAKAARRVLTGARGG